MRKCFLTTAALLALFFSPLLYAAAPNYAILIDAGSTGSRLHLFQYKPGKPLPIINDIFSTNNKPGLSSFANNPAEASTSLEKMLDEAKEHLDQLHIDPHTVSISILGTAGMRLLPYYVQQDIYKHLRAYIKKRYGFALGDIKTISGKLEGIYGWLDINYSLHTLTTKKDSTNGSIDMGGASTQIAFSTPKPAEGTLSIPLGRKNYNVMSKSFLGLGLVQALQHVNIMPLAAACYPTHYAFSPSAKGSFNYNICSSLYNELIRTQQVAEILPLPKQNFVAFSGAYYTFQFFGIHSDAPSAVAKERVQTVCSQSWEKLKRDYPQVAEKDLASYCANGVYLTTLLDDTYQIPDGRLNVIRKLDDHDVDWTLGALLYRLVLPPPRPIIVDTDGGTDDSMALLYLLKNPHIEIKAITIEGNGIVRCPAGSGQILQLLKMTEHEEIPVACGKATPIKGDHHYPEATIKANEDLGHTWAPSNYKELPPAEDLFTDVLQGSPERIDILAIGPLTTIAEALEKTPELKNKIGRIYAMGGAINVPGNVHEADPSLAQQKAEWNFYIDPYAAQQVLNSGVAITLVPLDVTNQVPLDMNFYKQIESWGNTAEGSFLYNLLTQNKAMLLNHLWYFWDPLAAAIAVNPSIAKIKTLPITVVQEPEIWSGATVVDRHKGRPIQVCMKVDSRKFKSLLLEMTI